MLGEVRDIYQMPVFFSSGYELSDAQIEHVKNLQYGHNEGNSMSLSMDVMRDPIFRPLSNYVDNCVAEYVHDNIGIAHSVEFHISSSWSNINKPGEYHHRHRHKNSIVNGVISLTEGNVLSFASDVLNIFPDWTFPYFKQTKYSDDRDYDIQMNKSDIVLFSSQMIHYVKKNTRTEDRISLGFNTMVGGEILMHTPNKLNMMVH
jgi:uncharacterized protein (TIGR02466 family)